MKALWICIPVAALILVSTGRVVANETLAKENGCFECHGLDQKNIGPSFADIAAKYQNDTRARAVLVEKIKKGSKGDWTGITGGVPMPPYSPRITDPDIKLLADWIVTLQ